MGGISRRNGGRRTNATSTQERCVSNQPPLCNVSPPNIPPRNRLLGSSRCYGEKRARARARVGVGVEVGIVCLRITAQTDEGSKDMTGNHGIRRGCSSTIKRYARCFWPGRSKNLISFAGRVRVYVLVSYSSTSCQETSKDTTRNDGIHVTILSTMYQYHQPT